MTTVYAVVIVYFGILFTIGFFASKSVKGSDDFFIGGKKLGYWVASFSALATGQSAWLILGLSGFGAVFGASAYWVMIGEVICISILWFKMSKPLKTFGDKHGCITMPDYLEQRFQDKSQLLRKISAAIIAIFSIIYISSQIDATGSAFESFLKWDYFVGAAIGFGIVVLYCFGGGFVAACWTDLFQGVMMFGALMALPLTVFLIDGGVGEVVSGINDINPNLLGLWGPDGYSTMALMTCIGFLLIGLGHMGSPQIMVRMLAVKSTEEISKGRWVAVIFTLVTEFAAVSTGIIARYLFTEAGDDPNVILGNGGQNSLPMVVEHFLPAVIVGVYIAAVLSAIMSTVSSLLIMASSAVARDYYQRILHPNKHESDLMGISRATTMIMAVIAFSIAIAISLITPERTIFWFVIFGWSGFAVTFCPMIIMSIFYRGYTKNGALASMVVGFFSVMFFQFVAPKIGGIGAYLEKLSALPPSFALAMLAGYLASRWKPDLELQKFYTDNFR